MNNLVPIEAKYLLSFLFIVVGTYAVTLGIITFRQFGKYTSDWPWFYDSPISELKVGEPEKTALRIITQSIISGTKYSYLQSTILAALLCILFAITPFLKELGISNVRFTFSDLISHATVGLVMFHGLEGIRLMRPDRPKASGTVVRYLKRYAIVMSSMLLFSAGINLYNENYFPAALFILADVGIMMASRKLNKIFSKKGQKHPNPSMHHISHEQTN